MKNSIIAASMLTLTLALGASAQVNPAITAGSRTIAKPAPATTDPAKATRSRVLNQPQQSPTTNSSSANGQSFQAHAKANFKNRARLESLRPEASSATDDTRLRSVATGSNSTVTNPKTIGDKNSPAPGTNVAANATASAGLPPTASQIYRVGVGDVLNIQLNENPGPESTLFTVGTGGMLEYPLAGDPVSVAGMTTSEIATMLRKKVKLFEDPTVVVNVRDYASHTVTINGFVAAPGVKTLRREAVPLYALLAESLVLPDAARVIITRSGNQIAVELKDPNLSATLVLPGDVIKVSGPAPAPTEFFFVGGEVKLPGQKAYHSGLTLTQAILAGGGATNGAGERVRVSRQGTDGRLVTEEFNIRKIQEGKIADPVLQKDDRIELTPAN